MGVIQLLEPMTKTENTTKISSKRSSPYGSYDDNQDILWPTVVGIFVALALGWMICRYKCSSKERSPHIVRCCPKTLCKNIRLCFMCIFGIKRKQPLTSESRMSTINRGRPSEGMLQEAPFLVNIHSPQRLSIAQVSQQWPPPFVLNQSPSFPLSIAIQSTTITSPPKRHPLRRDSALIGHMHERQESTLWPFHTPKTMFQ